VHLAMFVLNMYARPYMNYCPDLLSITIAAANVFNCSISALLFTKTDLKEDEGTYMSYEWIYAIYAINFGAPLLAITFGWYFNRQRKQRRLAEGKRVGKPVDSEKMAKQRRLIERNINEYTLRFLVSWTSIILLSSCLAAELIFIGQFEKMALTPVWAHATPTMVPPSTEPCAVESQMRKLEFIGYDSWGAFTDNCCCMSRTSTNLTAASPEPSVELWMCRNASVASGVVSYKERQRRPHRAAAIPAVRPFCGTTFRDTMGNPLVGYEPYWDSLLERFVVDLPRSDGSISEIVIEYW